MMESTTIVSFDFGSANVRAAKTRLLGASLIEPQMVEFDGRPQLANHVLLPAGDQTPAVFGENVFRVDPSEFETAESHWGLAVEEVSDGQIGQASRLLLAHIITILARDHQFAANDAQWQALVAAPIAGRPDAGARLEARLRETGFVDVRAASAALAALAHYAGEQPRGRYVVIDLGASETRLAVVEAHSGSQPVVRDVFRGRPGGRDFDRALFNYFSPQLQTATGQGEFDLTTRVLIEQFKRDFSMAWAEENVLPGDAIGHSGLYRAGIDRLTLALDVETFLGQSVAGPLVERFRQMAGDFVDRHAPGGDLSGLILVGGGAHWPFVVEWAQTKMGRDRVLTDQYPEAAIVRGLLRLTPQPELRAEPAPEETVAQADSRGATGRPRPARDPSPTMSPGRAFALEFVGGLFGVLGLGWFIGRRQVAAGCLALVGWWIILVTLFVLGIYSAAVDQPVWLLGLALLWLAVPFTSAFILSRRMASQATDRAAA